MSERNRGKEYYTCSKPFPTKCEFFKWANAYESSASRRTYQQKHKSKSSTSERKCKYFILVF